MKWTCWVVAIVGFGCVAPAQAAEVHAVYKSIPDNVLAVGVAHKMAATGNKLATVGAKLQLAAANPVSIAKVMLGIGEGLDETGTLATVLLPPKHEGGDPTSALYVQVADYDQLIKPLKPRELGQGISKVTMAGREMVVAHKDDYAVFARLDDEDALKQILAASDGVEKIIEPVSDWLAEQDIALMALPKSIALGTAFAETSLAQASKELAAGGDEMKPALAMFGMYQEALEAIGTELTHGCVGIKLADDGDVMLSLAGAVEPDGKFARSIASIHWPKRLGLAQIPEGDYAIAGAMAYPHAWAAELMQVNFQMMSSGGFQLSEKQAQEYAKISIESMQQIKSFALVARPIATGESFLDRTSGIMLCDDAPKYLQKYPALLERMNKITGESKESAMPQVVAKPIKIEGLDAFEVSMDMGAMIKQMEQGNPLGGAIQKKIFGEDGMLTAYLTAADRETIVMTYGSKESLIELVNNKQSFTSDERLKEVDKLLPDDPAGVMYWNVAGIVDFANTVMPMFNPDARKLPEFPAAPPIGMSLKFSKHAVEGRVAVKSELLEQIGEYVAKVRNNQ